MTYEKEIPEYAMVPAREVNERIIVPVTKGAIYSPMQVTNITDELKTVITIEEDILVPDTKPDLREILMIDGKGRLAVREVEPLGKGEDCINLTGEVELQTLYLPEDYQQGGPVISVQMRVPFKERWNICPEAGSIMTLDCKPEKIDYMVINERKYRVKISLAVFARQCGDCKIEVFEGISGEELEMCKEKIQLTNIVQRKKDTISINQVLDIAEEAPSENILKQDITVVENYKQMTGEKLVINGFVYVSILYALNQLQRQIEEDWGQNNEDGLQTLEYYTDNIKQAQERVEFTQFIPLQGGGQLSGSNVTFDSSGLRVKLVSDEEHGESLCLEGEIITHVELYKNVEKEIIVDGYHKEKDFICDFMEEKCRTLVGSSIGEASVREIISPDPAYGDIEKIIYTTAEVAEAKSRSEQGKVITEGTVAVRMICQSKIGGEDTQKIFSIRREVPFRVVTAAAQLKGGEIICHKIHIKDIWAEKINTKQIEFNGVVAVCAEIMEERCFKVLVNPAFEESLRKERPVPMVVYITGGNDSLWTIAKKFKTSVETISQINRLDGAEPVTGQKLLILK